MRSVNVYAASTGAVFGAQPENYGDNLMAPLLRELFGVEAKFVPMDRAEMIGIGSIIDSFHRRKGSNLFKLRPWRKLHVWGAGFMNESGKAFWPQRVEFHAVRGPLSREKVGKPDLPLGDPAILVPLIWPKPPVATRAVSIIPHFITFKDFVQSHAASLPKHWHIIDLMGDPKTISNQIASSDVVVSSSLHGLILADAYQIQSVWMRGDARIKGDGFKFRDYEAYRGLPFGGPIDFSEVLRDGPHVTAASPPSCGDIDALRRAMPFA